MPNRSRAPYPENVILDVIDKLVEKEICGKDDFDAPFMLNNFHSALNAYESKGIVTGVEKTLLVEYYMGVDLKEISLLHKLPVNQVEPHVQATINKISVPGVYEFLVVGEALIAERNTLVEQYAQCNMELQKELCTAQKHLADVREEYETYLKDTSVCELDLPVAIYSALQKHNVNTLYELKQTDVTEFLDEASYEQLVGLMSAFGI